MSLTPLLAALMVCVGLAFYVLKKKSLAQAICIHQASRMQNELKSTLQKLLRLNTRATTLRAQRESADRGVQTAVSSGYPPAIAAAKAIQVAVILQQTELAGEQALLLAEAERQRGEGQRDLRQRVSPLAAGPVQATAYYFRALAVEPSPVESLSPDYKPVSLFSQAQQQRFRFQVDLSAGFPVAVLGLSPLQATECSVTLEEKEDEWRIRILAAKASSSYF